MSDRESPWQSSSYFVVAPTIEARWCDSFDEAVAVREELVARGHEHALIARRVLTRVIEVGNPLTPPNGRLSGEALREVIAEYARRRDEPFHYRELFAEIEEHGHVIGGKDPIATFLTQLIRVDGISRFGGQRSGVYTYRSAA